MQTTPPTRVPQCNTFDNDTVPAEEGFKSFSVQVANYTPEPDTTYELVQITGGAEINRGGVSPGANPQFNREPADSVFRVDATALVQYEVITYENRITTIPGQTAP